MNVCHLICDGCNARFKGLKVNGEVEGPVELRKRANAHGWHPMAYGPNGENDHFYDYCPSCRSPLLPKHDEVKP
jgi:hypothetical protein